MKKLSVIQILTAGAIALSTAMIGTQSHGQPAPGQSGFWCATSSGAPATLYQNRQGGVEPWIYWTSDAFSGSGYTPERRCQEVSSRLETYRRNRQLQFITVGRMNNQNVICTASQVNGRCENLIYTLKAGQDPIATLYNFLAWREGQAATPSLFESTQPSAPYIDLRDRLGDDSAPAAPVTQPSNPVAPSPQPVAPAQPVAPPPSNSGGMREL
ncbi:MAG: COP23 domain-containing protein [Roseofilum sp. SBFL]|uniref:COP23 domain-containing protein n=1 Tax=unclassified Roseofilum TaxID=2620099 RepID=UPI001B1494D3|nr:MULTISPECIES: COP23 domain-containing protein [unclassified Roseofilum]MBP0014682.1 COP23 domain-containing protein [Roseofilum sp. SID3]MBP0023609.1 COP23 domain-containing protein [Roseofilum sp. SID2]MBP0041725.1 COP23 domain-containing protein [Roseofilum sp. SBFL]